MTWKSLTWLWSTLFFYLLLLLLKPIFFTFDSYDYLGHILSPKVGAAHPLGFSFILYLFSLISNVFNAQFYTEILLFWNALGAGLLCHFIILPLWDFAQSGAGRPMKAFVSFLVLLLLAFVVPSILFVSNALWSEGTNLLHIALFGLLVQSFTKVHWTALLVFAAGLSAWSYQTRYSEVVLPVCFLGIGLITWIKRHYFREPAQVWKRQLISCTAVFGGGAIGIVASTWILSSIYPVDLGQKYVTSIVLSASIQCALRCDVGLYEKDCSTPEGRELIETFRCGELIFSVKPFGPRKLGPWATLSDIASFIGPRKFAKWILYAPFTYLSDTHSTEMGNFRFADDPISTQAYPEVAEQYSKYFVHASESKKAGLAFGYLHEWIAKWFWGLHIYHALTVLSVLLSIFVLWKTQDLLASYFAFSSVGTYLLFSYLNPHVPLRYLVMIILPGLISAFLYFARLTNGSAERSV